MLRLDNPFGSYRTKPIDTFLLNCPPRKCKYTEHNKFLVEVEDRVDDETLESLRIIEECQAAAGELPKDIQGFSLAHGKSFDPEADEYVPPKDESKIKLDTFPEIVAAQLPQRIKKYKDAALSRKQRYNGTSERLQTEKSTGHESFGSMSFRMVVLIRVSKPSCTIFC